MATEVVGFSTARALWPRPEGGGCQGIADETELTGATEARGRQGVADEAGLVRSAEAIGRQGVADETGLVRVTVDAGHHAVAVGVLVCSSALGSTAWPIRHASKPSGAEAPTSATTLMGLVFTRSSGNAVNDNTASGEGRRGTCGCDTALVRADTLLGKGCGRVAGVAEHSCSTTISEDGRDMGTCDCGVALVRANALLGKGCGRVAGVAEHSCSTTISEDGRSMRAMELMEGLGIADHGASDDDSISLRRQQAMA